MVIYGDGLNILSETPFWWDNFESIGIEAILTPHPGEMLKITRISELPIHELLSPSKA